MKDLFMGIVPANEKPDSDIIAIALVGDNCEFYGEFIHYTDLNPYIAKKYEPNLMYPRIRAAGSKTALQRAGWNRHGLGWVKADKAGYPRCHEVFKEKTRAKQILGVFFKKCGPCRIWIDEGLYDWAQFNDLFGGHELLPKEVYPYALNVRSLIAANNPKDFDKAGEDILGIKEAPTAIGIASTNFQLYKKGKVAPEGAEDDSFIIENLTEKQREEIMEYWKTSGILDSWPTVFSKDLNPEDTGKTIIVTKDPADVVEETEIEPEKGEEDSNEPIGDNLPSEEKEEDNGDSGSEEESGKEPQGSSEDLGDGEDK